MKVIFVAKRNIMKGEEVTECYGIHHLSMDKQARQEKLKRGYAFDCACEVTSFTKLSFLIFLLRY